MDHNFAMQKLAEYGFRKREFKFAFDCLVVSSESSVLSDRLLFEELSEVLPGYTFTIIPDQFVFVISK